MAAFLGVDLGTTRIKVGLFDGEGRRISLGMRRAPAFRSEKTGNALEFDLLDYWQCFVEATRDAVTSADAEPDAVGFSSQAQSFTAFDAAGRSLRPVISWLDDRARAEAEDLREAIGAGEFYRFSGFNEVTPLGLAPKLMWLRLHEPHVFERAKRFALLRDYFVWRLTGTFTTDPTLVTLGGVYDRFQEKYWKEILDFIGVREECLPRVIASGEVCGMVKPEAARELGLPAGIPVVPGCLDQIASAVGVGNIYPGMVSVNMGTVITIFLTRTDPDVDLKNRMLLGNHVTPNQYFLMPYIQAGGLAVDWFREVFSPESGYSDLEAGAENIEPGCDGLVFIPHLAGCFSPEVHPDARGHFCNISLNHKRDHFYRAVLEGIAFALRENLELLGDFGAEGEDVRLFGGGSTSALWTQIIADVTGRDVHRPDEPEASCLGAAMLAAVAAGHFTDLCEAAENLVHQAETFSPRPENRIVYDEAYEIFRSFQQRTFPQEEK